jgi:hypothetical protein
MKEEEYLKERVEGQIGWYERKSARNKKLTHWSKGLVIALSVSIPVVAGFPWLSESFRLDFTGLLGGLVSGISGITAVMKFQDKWTKYRLAAEMLTHEKMLYTTRTGPYERHEDPFKLLVPKIENIIAEETAGWKEYVKKEE